jgi:phosphoribosyl 1,2-cyclic phosphodiesterase/CheY-like chemotaxis protein
MQKKLCFLIVDADKTTADLCQIKLETDGHIVILSTSHELTPEKIITLKPNCIIYDISVSADNCFKLLSAIRANNTCLQPSLILITAETATLDYKHLFQLQVHRYLPKPLHAETLTNTILAAHAGEFMVHFWGTRGTLPVPGKDTLHYGGNTNCISLHIAQNHFFIFDAGTGIKELSNYILREMKTPISAKVFLSHPHYDHINGIPFFAPLYVKENTFEFFGTHHSHIGIEKLISDQMDGVYFPITVNEFAAHLYFRDLNEETFYIDDIEIQTIFLNHPGKSLGYRIRYLNKIFCYVTDNEIYLEDSPQHNPRVIEHLLNFIKDADVVVIDATYTDAEYIKKIGWGHSCVSRVVEIAHQAEVKLMYLFHHDPDQLDKDIDKKLQHATTLLHERHSKTRCVAAKEGEILYIK